MDSMNYKKLYELQDSVLDIIFSINQDFYLTGGTCLSRFYQEKRYSDDLDFFTHNGNFFSTSIRKIKIALSKHFTYVEEVSSRDFIRLKVNDLLQLDFVNDQVMRYDPLVYLDNGYVIDNCKNILANKITAVIGRDNPKDIFDILLIEEAYRYEWKEILSVAHEKAGFSNDDLIVRLKTFPIRLLNNILLIDSDFLNDFELKYNKLIEKIEKGME